MRERIILGCTTRLDFRPIFTRSAMIVLIMIMLVAAGMRFKISSLHSSLVYSTFRASGYKQIAFSRDGGPCEGFEARRKDDHK